MGLDMYVESVNAKLENQSKLEDLINETNLNPDNSIELKELFYYRKHSDLNKYFQDLYYELTDSQEEFNCVHLLLRKQDIINLLARIDEYLENNYSFEEGVGFFWGSSSHEDWEQTKEDFTHILNTFDFERNSILYHCWYWLNFNIPLSFRVEDEVR